MNIEFPCGSEWKRWDLHIHTPASFHWNDGKKLREMTSNEKSELWNKVIRKMNATDVAAFSFMDYFTFDGILDLRRHISTSSDPFLNKVVFPGIELRVDAPVDYRLNIHAIFSELVTDQELADFKSTLSIFGTNRPLSDAAIIDAARALPADKAKEIIGSRDYKSDDSVAFELGMKTIKVTRESLKKAVDALSKEKCLIILPYDTSDGVLKLDWKAHPHDDCFFFRNADIFEVRSKDNVDLFLNRKNEKNSSFIDSFVENMGGMPKPVISGSDAHKVSDYGSFLPGKTTWIKAATNFKGLRQTLVEPESRTYIGDIPEKLKVVTNKSTKFISKVDIKKKPDAKIDETWFNNVICFNPELVAIIGNKGSGKSALADIVGLLGNSRQENSFSFLNEKKFRERQGYKADKFFANLYWVSGSTINKALSEHYVSSSVESIKYIPQSYLEKLCNEINSNESLFDQELKTVIFSHIDIDQRLGLETLDALIDFKTEEIKKEILLYRQSLNTIIKQILDNEAKLTDQYRQSIVNQLSSKQSELEAHIRAKPPEQVRPPQDSKVDSSESGLVKELVKCQEQEAQLQQAILQKYTELENHRKKKALAEKLISQIELIERGYRQSVTALDSPLKELGLDGSSIFSFSINKQPVMDTILVLSTKIAELVSDLSVETTNGSSSKLALVQNRIKEIADSIDEPNRKYQAYLEELEKWNKTFSSIQGDTEKPGTISYLNSQLSEVQNIPKRTNDLEEQRDILVSQIFSKIDELSGIYKQFYAPVQKFVSSNPFGDETFKISFDVSIVDVGFQDGFFPQINRNRIGTFCGIEESEKFLSKILDKYDFNKSEDVKSFTREILHCLKFDCRDDKAPPSILSLQIKDTKVFELYQYIFSLKYMEPKYSLKLNTKSLEQLSPGERGTLLLIFYLMVDKDDRPLILDQPEENLDNQTIYKVLVPCIKNAKKNRQIFLVTHNPNLAIVCDAEQVIVARIDKASQNAVEYVSGPIEDMEINRMIVDILEGTRPAFDNRDSKYFD